MPNLKTDLEKESGDILTSSKPFLICITMPFNLPTNLTIHVLKTAPSQNQSLICLWQIRCMCPCSVVVLSQYKYAFMLSAAF